MKTANIVMLLALIGVCLLVELMGGWLTSSGVSTWYPSLAKPFWTPPNFLFGPIWTVLYILMGVALWLIWLTPTRRAKGWAYLFFSLQLVANLIWSGLFFWLHSPFFALIDILLLLLLIIATIWSFHRIRPLAAYLLLPYLLWVAYATALNGAIWHLNG